MTCVCTCLCETTSVIKSISGRVHPMGMYLNYQVYKWTSSSHEDALKLLSSQVDEFIIRSISGQVHPIGIPFKLPSP